MTATASSTKASSSTEIPDYTATDENYGFSGEHERQTNNVEDEPAAKAVKWSNIESLCEDGTERESRSGNNHRRATYGKLRTEESMHRIKLQEENNAWVIFPWDKRYKAWWGFSVFMSVCTIFFETYQIAFGEAGMAPHNDPASIIEFFFLAVFCLDICINFNLAYYDDQYEVVTDRKTIARNYASCMFWVDLIGVFPFYSIALLAAGEMGKNSTLAEYLGITRLLRLVRLHRVKQLFDALQYNTHISLMSLTLTRNFGAALVWTHIAACVMYFIARQHGFEDDETWIGGQVYGQTAFERYITALYWSVVTFTT
jgi:hypothetical protein